MCVVAVLALASGVCLADEPPSAQEILAASDAVRNPNVPFGVTSVLTEYKEGRENDTSTLLILSKADKSSGQFKNLIQFAAPERDANKRMLKNGNDLWFYDPANKASVRISPQQRLLGQAANGDVVTANLAKDYKVSLGGQEDITDGDRKTVSCYKLELTATATEVTYERIELWVERSSNRAIKARFLTDSGRLLKTAYYRRYEPVLGAVRPTETVIIDGLNSKWVTIIRNSNYGQREIPDAWMQRDYLQRAKLD